MVFAFRDRRWLPRVMAGAALELLPAVLTIPLVIRLARIESFRPSLLVPLALASLLALLGRLVVLGYLGRLVRGVLDGSLKGLPAWDRFPEDLLRGASIGLVTAGVWLPAAALFLVTWITFAWLGIPALAWLTALLVAVPASLATLAVMPAALVTAIATDDPAAAFNWPLVRARIQAAGGAYVLAFLVAVAAEIVAQLGLLACCVGVIATRFLAHCITAHAFASAFRTPPPPRHEAPGPP